MNINLVPYSHDTFSPETGGYFLVRTVSNVLKTVRMFSAHVSKTWDVKNEKFVFSIDVSGQKVTHISEQPIK